MKKNRKVVLTGGGTAGHVMPHVAMLPEYRELGWTVHYIGSSGIEKEIMQDKVPFHEISAGKLRRYFSVQNFIDVFKVFWGTVQSLFILLKLRPSLVFSKGGFVSVPVAVSAWFLRIPVFSHESDLTPGLANKIINPLAKKIFFCFPETKKFLSGRNAKLVGLPIRKDLHEGNANRGRRICGFPQDDKKVILVMGGSLGAQRINEALLESLPKLVTNFRVIHITGRGKGLDYSHESYKSFEFLKDELKDVFALSDLVVSRSGANSIFEFLELRKPMLLIPLEIGSRGDQIDNAKSFQSQGVALLLRETELSSSTLMQGINDLNERYDELKNKLENPFVPSNPSGLILQDFLEPK